MFNLSPHARRLLERAGWFPGRSVFHTLTLPKDFILFPAARAVLDEFGGLKVGEFGPGITCARSKIIFDPSGGYSDAESLADWMRHLGLKLYPIGTANDGWVDIFLDEEGRMYGLGDYALWLKADCFEKGLENLLTGVKGQELHMEQ